MSWLTGMLGRLASKLIGSRVLLGLLIAAMAAVGFLYWRMSAAQAEIEAASMRASQYRAAHRSAVEALEAERQEAALREQLLAEQRQKADARDAQIGELRDALDQAREQGSTAYRDCLDVHLPRALRERLRDYRSDSRAADPDAAAAGVDGD
ncbi:hypothetical protein [Arhodomonas sp. AD133]|uniref:hypothetical protein n=1 Tax=Arhodomonas sp. AD133 TaxID=3415009 RepID=UPI003EC06C05